MSISIKKDKCVGCKKCLSVCPGSLIKMDTQGKAYIKYPKNCWGCTACLKECSTAAIKYYLGADIGGNGAYLYVKEHKDELIWNVVDKNINQTRIIINRKESNKY